MNSTDICITIRPNQSWLRFDWRGLVQYSDLLFELVLRDFTAKYKQTVLGPIWSVANPLLTTIVFTLLFGRVLRVPTNGVPPLLFYLCSLLAWTYFANVLAATGRTLTCNARIFSKVYFPRLIPPIALTVSNLFALGIQLLFFGATYAWFRFFTVQGADLAPTWWLLLVPLVIVHVACAALGVGLIISAVTAKYRDLHHVTGMLIQLWMYATPVIYPLSKIPPDWRWLAGLNPMTAVTETMRQAFLGAGHITLSAYGVSLAISLGFLLTGVLLYQRMARTFVDVA